MKAKSKTPRNVDEYIAGFPADVGAILEKVRATIKKAVPGAEEVISYKMPTFTLNGSRLIFFAGFKKHIGLYPAPIDNPVFRAALLPYQGGKATAKFPLDQPIPFDLITKIVKFRVKETGAKVAAKEKKK